MINYLLILIGSLLLIMGLRWILSAVADIAQMLQRLEDLLQDKRFTEIEQINRELNELNYSYYEILEKLDNRLTELEGGVSSLTSARRTDRAKSHSAPLGKIADDQSTLAAAPISEQAKIEQMIGMGFTDRQIGKALGIGSGKVAVIRQIKTRQSDRL